MKRAFLGFLIITISLLTLSLFSYKMSEKNENNKNAYDPNAEINNLTAEVEKILAENESFSKNSESILDNSISSYEEQIDTNISLYETLDYEDILRYPNLYNNKNCQISGTISQIIEGFLNTSIFVEDSNGNIWGCTYHYSKDEKHFLEGDYVYVYGTCYGTQNTKTLLGKQVTLPYIQIEEIH